MVDRGELYKAKERIGDTEEAKGRQSLGLRRFGVRQGYSYSNESIQLVEKDCNKANHIREYLLYEKLDIAIIITSKVCSIYNYCKREGKT